MHSETVLKTNKRPNIKDKVAIKGKGKLQCMRKDQREVKTTRESHSHGRGNGGACRGRQTVEAVERWL